MKTVKEKYRARVAVVTGGLLHVNESSLLNALKKQIHQVLASKNHWLATKIKLRYGY